jgi:hypothetical protein
MTMLQPLVLTTVHEKGVAAAGQPRELKSLGERRRAAPRQ